LAKRGRRGEIAVPPSPENGTSPPDGITRQKSTITDAKMMSLACRLKPEEQWTDADNNCIAWKTESVIAQVFTDAGVTGIGGCSRYNGPQELKEHVPQRDQTDSGLEKPV
jgi:hypothetical protein